MRINSKILSFFIGIFVLSIAVFLITWQYQHSKLESMQKQGMQESQSRFDESIALQSKALKTFVYENSYWDEMVSFVSTQNTTWAEETFVSAIEETQEYDYVAIYDEKKSTIFYHQHDDEKASIKNLLPRSTLKMKEPFFSHYFLVNDDEVVEIYSAPIQPSKDTKRKSVPRGYLVMGKVWDKAHLEHFSKSINLNIEVVPDSKINEDEADFIYPLKSYDGETVAYMKVKSTSVMLDALNNIFMTQFMVLVLFGCLMIGAAYLIIDRTMVKPLKTISNMITSQAEKIEEKSFNNDEFAEIVHSLETLLNKQKTLENEKAQVESELARRDESDVTIEAAPQQDPVLDVTELNEIIGSKKLVDKFLRKFLDELITKYAILPAQIANHEEIAPTSLHTLKGTSANVRAYRLHYACRAIDDKYKSGAHILSGEIDTLKEAMNEVKERLVSLGYSPTEAGGLSVSELHQLYDDIKETLNSLNTVLPEKQRILTANLQEVVDPNALEEWDWAMCENEYDKALTLMMSWKIFNGKS